MSLNRLVFNWHLKVRKFLHSRMSAGRVFQVDGAATDKARWVSSVCMRGTSCSGTAHRPMGLRYVGVAVVRIL